MKIRVAVLFGGRSVEHEISIISALQAMNNLDSEKYEVMPVYITKNCEMYTGEALWNVSLYKDMNELYRFCVRVVLVNEGSHFYMIKYPHRGFSKGIINEFDVVLPVVHGTNVEDGVLQGYLKMLNIPYAGSDVISSAIGMDKYIMKSVLKDSGIPVLPAKRYTTKDYSNIEYVLKDAAEHIGYPLIVKPVNLGSSIGITVAKDENAFRDALDLAFEFSENVIVEKAITDLTEINCSVLGDRDEAEASECERPFSDSEILSYQEKYMRNGTKGAKGTKSGKLGGSKGMAGLSRQIPADISPEMREKIRALSVEAFKCLGCSGVARIDFMIDNQTGEVWFNEINTIPGSLSFYLWEPLGLKYKDLLSRVIDLAFKRQRVQDNIQYTFEGNIFK